MKTSKRRALWRALSPFVWAAHRLGWCSYKWVNVCHGARRPDRFDALWQYEWYGAPIRELPAHLTLCGIGYRASASEGIVTFVAEFTRCRITFERDVIAGEGLWYLTLSGMSPIAASHVDAAYRWVKAIYGGSHEWKAAA